MGSNESKRRLFLLFFSSIYGLSISPCFDTYNTIGGENITGKCPECPVFNKCKPEKKGWLEQRYVYLAACEMVTIENIEQWKAEA